MNNDQRNNRNNLEPVSTFTLKKKKNIIIINK